MAHARSRQSHGYTHLKVAQGSHDIRESISIKHAAPGNNLEYAMRWLVLRTTSAGPLALLRSTDFASHRQLSESSAVVNLTSRIAVLEQLWRST